MKINNRNQPPDFLQQLKEVFIKTGQEIERLKQGKPSIFGFPGSKFSPHRSDYEEVYLLWDFVGSVARIQKRLQDYFGFQFSQLSRPPSIVPQNNYVHLPIYPDNQYSVPPGKCTLPTYYEVREEEVGLWPFEYAWKGIVIIFRCGYGQETNRLIFSEQLDYRLL